jgi:transmembrane protein TMEM260 (protein O-mannosyltransferase)
MAGQREDVIAALLVGAGVMALYILTLRPDVGGFEDAPKFQFVGYVLGTAHSPGYPLYVLLTHLAGKLPIGTIAYRVNLFSATMAAAACAGGFILARQLGAPRAFAAAAAITLAASANFWRYAVVAEVYSLAAALVVCFLVMLIAWSHSGRLRDLFAACAIFAAALGNHLTIVGVVPAAVAYAATRDRRVLTTRVIAIAALIVILGLAQYGFVVLRTVQQAPYLDAHASSVSELPAVLTARDFTDARFQYTIGDLARQRVPTIARALIDQLTPVGALLLLLGFVEGVRRRSRDVALVAGAAAGMTVIVMNLNGDDTGFLTPITAVLCPVVAVGMESVRAALARLMRPAATAAAVGAFALPAFLLAANFPAADQHTQWDDSRTFRALYGGLPKRAAIVADDYWTGMMLLYLRFTGEVKPDPEAVVIPETADAVQAARAEGRQVFAFQESAAWFAANGLTFRPVTFRESTLQEWLRQLPRGTVVAAASAGESLPLHVFPSAVGRAAAASAARRPFEALVWTVGNRDVRFVSNASSSETQTAIGYGWWRSARFSHEIQVRADADRGAVIHDGNAAVVRVDGGTAIAVFAADGHLRRTLQYEHGASLDVPVNRQLYAFDRAAQCADLRTDAPTDVTNILREDGWLATTSRMGETVAALTIDSDDPLGLRYRAISGDGSARVEKGPPGVMLAAASRTGARRPVFALSVGAPVRRATAIVTAGGADATLRVCASPMAPLVGDEIDAASIVPELDRLFGAGWYEAERSGDRGFRWAGKRSTLLLPLRSTATLRIRLMLRPARGGASMVAAAVNGTSVGACALQPDETNECALTVPADALPAGINYLTLTADRAIIPATAGSSRDRRELAFSLLEGEVRVMRGLKASP